MRPELPCSKAWQGSLILRRLRFRLLRPRRPGWLPLKMACLLRPLQSTRLRDSLLCRAGQLPSLPGLRQLCHHRQPHHMLSFMAVVSIRIRRGLSIILRRGLSIRLRPRPSLRSTYIRLCRAGQLRILLCLHLRKLRHLRPFLHMAIFREVASILSQLRVRLPFLRQALMLWEASLTARIRVERFILMAMPVL